MRTSTTFLVFGVVLFGLLVFAFFSQRSAAEQPYLQTANGFLHAAQTGNLDRVKDLTDPETCHVLGAGKKLTGLRFENITAKGVFAKSPTAMLTYVQLAEFEIEKQTMPVIDDDLATVTLNKWNKLYLHKAKGQWKVFYISIPGTDYTVEADKARRGMK